MCELINYNFQKSNNGEYSVLRYNLLPYGYLFEYNTSLNYFNWEYALPLAYPDLRITNLMYIQRIRCSFGVEYAKSESNTYQTKYLNIIFDGNLLRYSYNNYWGVKLHSTMEDKSYYPSIIYGVNF